MKRVNRDKFQDVTQLKKNRGMNENTTNACLYLYHTNSTKTILIFSIVQDETTLSAINNQTQPGEHLDSFFFSPRGVWERKYKRGAFSHEIERNGRERDPWRHKGSVIDGKAYSKLLRIQLYAERAAAGQRPTVGKSEE